MEMWLLNLNVFISSVSVFEILAAESLTHFSIYSLYFIKNVVESSSFSLVDKYC